MEASSTYPKTSFLRLVLPLLILCGIVSTGLGQTKEYATWAPSGGRVPPPGIGLLPGAAGVNDMPNAAISNDDNYAVMIADRALGALGIVVAGGDAYLQLKFPTNRTSGATTYVRVDAPEQSGLPLNLGQLLGLVGSSITAEVYSGAGNSSSSNGTLVDVDVVTRLIQDGNGNYFLAITPEAGTVYNSVRIDLKYPDGLADVAGRIELNVYNAFTFDDITCGIASYASVGETTGVNVTLTDVVQNPEFAVDADANTHSTITSGALSLVGSIFQSFYFNGLSAPQDYFKIKLRIGGGSLLDLNLLGNFEVRAYNGNELVYTKKLQGALVNGLDLLTLLESGDPITVPFAPGVLFDRVAIGINTTVAVNLASSPLEVYHVERYGLGDSPLMCVDPEPPLADEGDDHMLGINKACADVLVGHEYANFPFNAIDGDPGTYAVLEATSGSLLGIGAYSGNIELGYQSNVPANTTSYLKIDMGEDGLLTALLDGSLGGLLGGVLNNVLFGDHYFDIQVNDENGVSVLNGSSANAFNGVPIRIVQDKYGAFYVAITPTTAYRSIRITEHFPALVGAEASRTMKVYGLCYSTGSEDCEQAFATYSESDGISLDLLGAGSAGVTNAHLAIDDDDPSVEDDETYSEIGIGAAGVGASTFQFVDFHTLSSPADYFKIKLGVENGSALDVELLNNIEIRAYDGDELVYSQRLQNGLVAGLDILGLLSTDNVVTIPIGPGVAFDRVAVGVSTLLDVNALSTPIRVYSIKRFGADCPDPNPLPNNPDTESPFNGPDCGVTLGEFENVNFAYNAIDGDIDTYATLSAGSGVVLGAGAYSGFIELGYDQPVPALETSYIRIDMADEGLLDALLGGSLGGLLAEIGDIVLLGNHYFDISVRDASGTQLYETSSNESDFTDYARIVRDNFGRYYIAFTADQPYQSVRITLNNTALAGLDAVTTMNVYSMCRETVFDPCEQATFTSFDGTGLTLNLLEGANPAGVINPQYVIDGNNSNYSELSLGTAAIGATIYQDIYFKTKVTTTATDKLRLRMQVPSALLNVDVLGAYRVYLYNGDDEVYDATLQNALINGLDLLGLLNSGGRVNVEFEPGAGITYDRVRFEVGSVVGLGIGNPVRLYNVYRISDACPDPEFEQPPFEVCADVIVDDGENVDDIQNLTDGNHNSYATIRSDAGLLPGVGSYSGFVELGFAAVVPAGTTSYIRIGYEEEVLDALLAGSLGGLVNDLLNGIALGDHYFNVIIKDGSGSPITNGTGSSQNLFADAAGQIRLVQDTKGRYYLAITPTVDYQSVRLEDHTTALLGLGLSEGHLDVYGMCHTPTTFECPAAFSTSYEGSGLNLDALNVGGAGVQNAFWAIDQNTSSASTLSLGTLGVGGTIQQHIQFDRVLAAGDPIQVRMEVGGGTLNASILSALEVVGYLDGVEVYVEDFNLAFVEANIADLLNAAGPADVTIEPDVAVDEIAFRLSGLLAVGVAPNLSIYHVIPFCESFAQSSLAVTKDGALADGVDFNEVTATIIDAGVGGPVSGQEVEFTITHVDGTITTETATTNADGEAVVQITSTMAGVASVTATVGGMVIIDGSPAEVTFIIPNNLSITKVADEPTGVMAGESTTFTVTITNDGPAPIAVGKVIPLNERPSLGLTITNYDVTSANATVTGTGNNASVAVTTAVPVAGTITLTITADVAANAPETVANGIDVWGPDRDPDNDTPDDSDDTDPIPVDRDYGLDGNVTKLATAGADAVAVAGEEFEYTVTVVNGGPSTILSGTVLFLQDELSAGQTITSIDAGSANITVGTVAADGSFTVTANEDIEETEQFTLTVTADVAGDITADVVNNTINVWSEDPAGDYSTPEGTDTTPDYPVDRDYGFEDPGAVVKVATDGTTAVATAGEAFSYTATLTNMGPSTINAGTVLYLQDLASAGQTITGITSDNGTVGTIGTEGEFTLTVADAVAPNGTIVLTVAVDVAADITADVVNNTINVWSEDPAGDYSTPEGTDTTPDYPVDRDYGFEDPGAVVKAATDGTTAVATAGEAFSYTATLTNMGPSTINAGTVLYLQDLASAGQTITGITSDNGTVGTIGANGEFTLTVADAVAPNETIVLTVTVDVAADITADVVNNTINVWSEDPAGDYSTPEGTDTTPDYPVDRDYGFEDPGAVVKVATDGTTAVATAGEAFSYTATLTNMGPSTINPGTVLYLQDLASAGQTVTGITSDNGTVGAIGASGEFTLTVADAVAPNGTIVLTVTVDVAADITADVVNNTINVWSDDPNGDYSTPEGSDTTPDYPVDRDYGFDEDGAVVKVATDGSAAVAIAGEAFSYTATLTNMGPSTINAGTVLYLQDLASAGQTITGITSDNGTVGTIGASGEFTLTVADAVAPNGTIVLTVAVDVAADITADVVNNTINVWSEDPAGDYSTPEGTDTTPDYPVDRDYDFGGDNVMKAAVDGAAAVAVAGEEFAYTVTVTNGGPSTITAGTVLYLQDALSAGQSINSITAGSANVTVDAVGADGFFTVTANTNIAEGETFTLTVTANVDADAPATINNTINIWSDDPAGDPSNPDGSDTTPDYPVDRESVLRITKDANDDRVTAGESTSFTLTITNEGPSAIASGEVISLGERPSAGLTVTGYEVTSGNGTVAGTGNSAEVTTSAVIPVGSTITLTVTAGVDADAPATITNGIDVWGPDKDPETDTPDDGDDTPEIPVDRESNLSITKVADDARVIAGGSTSFTVTVTNDGPSAIASGEVISLGERPTAGLTITGYTVTSGNGTATGTGNSATVTTSAVIPVGGTITLTVTADVDANAPATVANGIDVWGPDKDPETDTPDDGDDTPEIPVDRESNLSITKVADDARVIAGGSTSFTVTVTNDGPSAIASGEVISLGERPTAGLTIAGYTVTSGNGTAAGTGNSATVTTSAVIPVGGTITVSVTADVDANAPATVANGIDVWGPDKDPETDTPDDGDDTPEIPVDRESNLGITKVADQSRVKAGTNTTFTVTVTNNGPSVIETGETIQLGERPSTGVTITGYEVISGAATIASTGNNATLTTTGAIAVDGTIVVRITAAVAADAPATITNGIDVWGPDKDPGTDDPDDEDDTPEIPVDPNYTLSITKEADQARVKAGTSTTFTVTITNNGPSSVANGSAIQVAERPGAGVTITGYEVTSGNATADGTANAATVNTTAAIPAGGTITLKISADIAGDAEGTITNGIAVWSPDKDPGTDDPDDEDDTPEIPVDPNRMLSITKVADQETVIAGTSTTFTVTVTNNGPSRILTGEVISLGERPSAGITITGYEVTSGNATVNGTGNSATLATTAAIAVDGTIVVKVTADVTAAVGQTISNGIAVWGPDKNPGTDEEDDETETPEIPVVAPYTLGIEKVADQSLITAGQPTTFTVTVTNNGPLEIEAGQLIALQERPGTGVTITGYEIISGAATVNGAGNAASLTTTGVVGVGATIVVRITADVAETATGTITNGIAVWGPDRNPDTDDPDDEDDTDPVPVDATIDVPNVFTPNGDGLNDRFVIKNLQQYQARELTVINRWGNQVYKSDNYNNDWDGGSLAEGTYYYILRYRNNGEWQTAKGAIAIIRITNR